jgi:uncharacterized membrane protein YtjA (UPF0391 family)
MPILRYALIFFALALLTGLFGFTSLTPPIAPVARFLFILFLLLSFGSVLVNVVRKG